MLNTVDEVVYMTRPVDTWISGKSRYPVLPLCIRHFITDFLQRCLSAPANSLDTNIRSPPPTLLLREWAKIELTGGLWRDPLVAALSVSISFLSTLRGPDTPLVWSL